MYCLQLSCMLYVILGHTQDLFDSDSCVFVCHDSQWLSSGTWGHLVAYATMGSIP